MSNETIGHPSIPGEEFESEYMPGHWLLARLGKRVLRPGGIKMTRAMLRELAIDEFDDVVEFAPGLGLTTLRALSKNPKSYTAIERDEVAAARVSALMGTPNHRCVQACAEETGLSANSATVVYGEAMLSMHADVVKQDVVAEASRVLKPGGRYGMHEICLLPDDLDEEGRDRIKHDLTRTTRVGVRPLATSEWCALIEKNGLLVEHVVTAPFHLLEPFQFLRDEGLANTVRIITRALRDGPARERALAMRAAIRRHENNLAAIVVVARKK